MCLFPGCSSKKDSKQLGLSAGSRKQLLTRKPCRGRPSFSGYAWRPHLDGRMEGTEQHPLWQWQGTQWDLATTWKTFSSWLCPVSSGTTELTENGGGKIVVFLQIVSNSPRKSGQEAVASFWSNPKIGLWRFPTWCQVLGSGQGPVTHPFHDPRAEASSSSLRRYFGKPYSCILGKPLRMVLTQMPI